MEQLGTSRSLLSFERRALFLHLGCSRRVGVKNEMITPFVGGNPWKISRNISFIGGLYMWLPNYGCMRSLAYPIELNRLSQSVENLYCRGVFFNKKGPSVAKDEQPKEFESTSVQTDGPLMV